MLSLRFEFLVDGKLQRLERARGYEDRGLGRVSPPVGALVLAKLTTSTKTDNGTIDKTTAPTSTRRSSARSSCSSYSFARPKARAQVRTVSGARAAGFSARASSTLVVAEELICVTGLLDGNL
jgi:hypothetical protein